MSERNLTMSMFRNKDDYHKAVVDKLLTHTEKQDNEITQLKALNKDLTDVLAKLDIEFIGLKAELEAHKEVVRVCESMKLNVGELLHATTEGHRADALFELKHDYEALEKLNKDN